MIVNITREEKGGGACTTSAKNRRDRAWNLHLKAREDLKAKPKIKQQDMLKPALTTPGLYRSVDCFYIIIIFLTDSLIA